jgi:hypothetical protein
MEQLLMVLVFALAAAVCVQAFVLSDRISLRGAERDGAVIAAERAAETIKGCRGDGALAAAKLGGTWLPAGAAGGGTWRLSCGDAWTAPDGGPAACTVVVTVLDSDPADGLGGAGVAVYDGESTELYSLNVLWQSEVNGDAA